MAQRRGPVDERLTRLVSYIGKYIFIPVYKGQVNWAHPLTKKLRDVLIEAGAVDVIYGREYHLTSVLQSNNNEYGPLPDCAVDVDPYFGNPYFSVFCHRCVSDIRHIIKTIESYQHGNLKNLKVEWLFINCKRFQKDIVYLGPANFECYSPRHATHTNDIEEQGLDCCILSSSDDMEMKSPLSFWKSLDQRLSQLYAQDFEEACIPNMSFREFYCVVCSLFMNVHFFRHYLDDIEASIQSACDDSEGSMYLLLHFKLFDIAFTHMKYLKELEDDPKALVNYLLICCESYYDELHQNHMVSEVTVLADFGHGLWEQLGLRDILCAAEVQQELGTVLCKLIETERRGDVINRSQIRSVVRHLMDFSLYEGFEKQLLVESLSYYSALASRTIKICDVAEYLMKVQTCMDEETERVQNYLDHNTEDKIVCIVKKQMVANHMKSLIRMLETSAISLIRLERYEEMCAIVKLVKQISLDVYGMICDIVVSYMVKSLQTLVEDKKQEPIGYIQLILNEREKLDIVISHSFGGDMSLGDTFYRRFQEISMLNFQLAEYVSLYIGHQLQNNLASIQAVSDALDKSVLLITDFEDKSVFKLYYQRHLADRLLSGRFTEKLEMEMLSRLKLQCSSDYLAKLTIMLNDVATSRQLMADFNAKNAAGLDHLPIYVHVLTHHSWPSLPVTQCRFPCKIAEVWGTFCSYYSSLYSDRTLDCYPTLGSAFISAKFATRREYMLNVDIYHTCILMLIDSVPAGMTSAELRERTDIPFEHLKKILFSMSCLKGKNILRKEPVGLRIAKNDRFYVNEDFCSESNTLVFDRAVQLKDAKILLEKDRSHIMDPLVLKFLKCNSVKDFNSITKEVATALKDRFSVTPKAVQERLKALIRWGLVVKVENGGNVYYKHYTV